MLSKKIIIILGLATSISYAAILADYSFKSPSFKGIGFSSHVLTIENQEHSRRIQCMAETCGGFSYIKH